MIIFFNLSKLIVIFFLTFVYWFSFVIMRMCDGFGAVLMWLGKAWWTSGDGFSYVSLDLGSVIYLFFLMNRNRTGTLCPFSSLHPIRKGYGSHWDILGGVRLFLTSHSPSVPSFPFTLPHSCIGFFFAHTTLIPPMTPISLSVCYHGIHDLRSDVGGSPSLNHLCVLWL